METQGAFLDTAFLTHRQYSWVHANLNALPGQSLATGSM